jgi:protein-disulfide isomerase
VNSVPKKQNERPTSRKALLVGGAVVIGVGLVIGLSLARGTRQKATTTAPPVIQTADRKAMGPKGAPLLIEYADFLCPHCATATAALTPKLVELANAGKVRFEFHTRVLWPEISQLPAEAAECAADQGRFWPYEELLFARQQTWTPSSLKGLAKEVGLDEQPFGRCLDSRQQKAAVEAETKAAADLGINSTPTFTLNGKTLELKQSYDEVIQAVEAAGQK